jgi:hypothetical protein
MNNVAMAKAYIIQALERMRHGEEAAQRGNYHIWLGSARKPSSCSSRLPSGWLGWSRPSGTTSVPS